MIDYDIDSCDIDVSKHFRNKYMRKWNWDMFDLRNAIKNAYKIGHVGKKKYEIYADKSNSKKIIFIYYKEYNSIFIISGAEKNEKMSCM